jgi:hypothetical protein
VRELIFAVDGGGEIRIGVCFSDFEAAAGVEEGFDLLDLCLLLVYLETKTSRKVEIYKT